MTINNKNIQNTMTPVYEYILAQKNKMNIHKIINLDRNNKPSRLDG